MVGDDDQPRSILLLKPRFLLLRPDVAPILGMYAAICWAYMAYPVLNDLMSYVFVVAVLVHAIVLLSAYWSVELRRVCHFATVTSVHRATAVRVIPTGAGRRQICRLLRMAPGGGPHFYWQKRQFVARREDALSSAEALDAFQRTEYPTAEPLGSYMVAQGMTTDAAAREALASYGPNSLDIPEPNFWELFLGQLLAPFFVFQLFCVALWSLDDYWYYSLFTLAMLAVFEATVVQSRMRTLADLRLLAPSSRPVCCLRGGRWQPISSADVVPGDLVSVCRSQSLPGDDVPLMADVLLLHGTAMVNEAMLTGESVPQVREPLADEPAERSKDAFDMHRDRAHMLFAGTTIVQHSAGAQPRALQPPDGGALGFVLRTGFATTQGRLLRTILFSREPVTANNVEVLVYISLLLCCALVAAAHVLRAGWADEGQDRHKLLLHCTMILTSVVPPELPMELSLAVNTSLLALHQNGIFCTEPFRIPFAGKTDVCCFDKTGTLTSDAMDVLGVSFCAASDQAESVPAITRPTDLPPAVAAVLASCQSVVICGGQVLGDPMECAVLKAVGWGYARPDVVAPVRGAPGAAGKDQPRPMQVRIHHRFPFRSALGRMSAIVTMDVVSVDGSGAAQTSPHLTVVCKGAPEVMRSRFVSVPDDYDRVFTFLARRGARVLAFGSKDVPGITVAQAKADGRDAAEEGLIFHGFLALSCPLKADTAAVLEHLHEAKHDLVMITGDTPFTACQAAVDARLSRKPIALLEEADGGAGDGSGEGEPGVRWTVMHTEAERKLFQTADGAEPARGDDSGQQRHLRHRGGPKSAAAKAPPTTVAALPPSALESPCSSRTLAELALAWDCCVPGRLLPKLMADMPPQAAGQALRWVRIFARVSPAQKEAIVRCLNAAGRTTLMMGDGTNDVGALKEAHVGVAVINPKQPQHHEGDINWGSLAAPGKRGRPPKRGASKGEEEDLMAMADFGQPALIKPGDASFASAFTSRGASISAAILVISQGRATHVTTIQMFKILGLNCLVSA